MRGKLELEVTLECFLDVLPNEELVQILQVRQSFKEEDALDQAVSVLHLVARCLALVPAKATQSPVIEHLGMHEVLVDCGELVGQDLVKAPDYLSIALHLVPSLDRRCDKMKGDAKVIRRLNEVLTNELTAIDQ